MKCSLVQNVKKFLKKNHFPGKPLLLGCSGGPDSLALFDVLSLIRKDLPYSLHVVHIDHSWRSESAAQAESLREHVEREGGVFHLHTLDPPGRVSNQEAQGREERLRFFLEIFQQLDAQALLLAHHAADQSETVLKRLFEGADLLSLGGMSPISFFNGMPIWRPFLKVKKEEILQWLQKRSLVGIFDKTNEDPRFLRARMRMQILPKLSSLFGKQIQDNLCLIGENAQEFKEYLDRKVAPYIKGIQRGPLGAYLDLNPFLPMERVELKRVVRKFFEEEGVSFTQGVSLSVLMSLEEGRANQRICLKHFQLFVDRGILFAVKKDLPLFCFQQPLSSCSLRTARWEWKISCEECGEEGEEALFSWKELWKGRTKVYLEKGDYALVAPQGNLPFPGSSLLRKWWTEQRTPAFLRTIFPLVEQNGKVVHEFLSGKSRIAKSVEKKMCICLEIKNIEDKL